MQISKLDYPGKSLLIHHKRWGLTLKAGSDSDGWSVFIGVIGTTEGGYDVSVYGGAGWDKDYPIRPWPVVKYEKPNKTLCFAWLAVFSAIKIKKKESKPE